MATKMEDLITRVLSGEASDSERRSVERWRQASADNERSFQQFLQTWRLVALRDPDERIPAPPPVARIVRTAALRRRYATPLHATPTWPRPVWRWAAAAAAVLVVAGFGAGRVLRTPLTITTTGPDDTRTIVLEDGSVVRLGPNSELRVRGNERRLVHLNGAAFFGVVTDSTRPFVVETSTGRAQVLGTRFEIRAGRESLRLVVVEGRVALAAGGRHVEARAGEVSHVRGGVPSEPESTDVWQLLDRSRELLIFQATPLQQVFEEVAAAFGTRAVIRDSALARRSVTAWFENEPMEEVVNTICRIVGARCSVGGTIEVDR